MSDKEITTHIENTLNAAVEAITNKTMRSKRQWDIAKITTILISTGTIIFYGGVYTAQEQQFKNDINIWKPEISKTVRDDHEYLIREQGALNQRMRDRNDAAGNNTPFH